MLTREREPSYTLKNEPSASADPRRRSRSLRSSIATGLISSEALHQGGVSLCPARHHTSVWRGPGRLRGWGAAPLTSGNRRTLQYFTPFRSLGEDSPREMVSDPVWRPRGQGSNPPTLVTSMSQDQTLWGKLTGRVWNIDRAQRVETGNWGEAPRIHTLTFYTAHSCTCCHLEQ